MTTCTVRLPALMGLLLWCSVAPAEQYTLPLLVPAGASGETQGVLRILNGTAESGAVQIYAIDDAGTRTGPASFTLNASQAVEFTATDLVSGNATLGLTGGIGTDIGDARLEIETDLSIVPLAYVSAADGTLSAMHDTVRSSTVSGNGYEYRVPIFNPATETINVSRLRLINPGDSAASVTIEGRDDRGTEASGGTVQLTLVAGAARTLTAQQLEVGATGLNGQLSAGVGKWRLTVSSDEPIQVVNVVSSSSGYMHNLSTTAVSGSAPADPGAFDERFVDTGIEFRMDRGDSTFTSQTGNRFTETSEADGLTVSYAGRYAYDPIGPDAGRVTATYDDGDACEINLYFMTSASGWVARRCTGADDPDGYWNGGNWSVAGDGGTQVATTYGVNEALPHVPTFGFFSPPTLVGARGFSSTVMGTTIVLNDGGYFEIGDGTRYTCSSSDGCTIANGRVTQGTVTETAEGGSVVDTFPTFRTATAPGDQTYTVGTAIEPLTLPEARGGDAALSYSLSPTVPGLTFNASTRELTGTPATAGAYAMTYTVTDVDGDSDTLGFTIAVEAADDGDGIEATGFDLDDENTFPGGIDYANERIYVVDESDGKVYAYRDDGQRDAAADFELHDENDSLEGLAYANNLFFAVDSADRKVYAYGAGGQRDAAADFELHDDNLDPRGITYANGTFYVVDWFNEKVFAYGEDGQHDPAGDFSLHIDNTFAWGIAHTGSRFYVVDELDAKVYAYGEDGQHDGAADFDLHDDNGFATGIAYANGRFYVVDWLVERVYTYGDTGTSPDLGSVNPDDRTYRVGTAIDALTLPVASGGDGALTYGLSPEVPGLSFSATTRQLTGTPSEAGTYSMTYTATDEDGDTDRLAFTITVQASPDDGATAYGVGDALPGVPASGIFVPAVVSVGSVTATGDGTTITLDGGGYFELSDGTRYTCTSSNGCTITDGSVIQGTLTGTAAAADGEVDRFPTFRMAMAPVNQTYTEGTAIDALTLPEASGGNGTLTYSLSPDIPGLTFSPAARQLTGTPSAAATYTMTYTAYDADGDTDVLSFTITVEGSGDGDENRAGIFDLHVRNAFPSGITYASGRFYVVDAGRDGVYAYDAALWQRDEGAEFELHADNSVPDGIAYAANLFYVIDGSDDKVYAYGDDGQRDTTAEFDLHDDNGSARGIDYAHDRFYVVDGFDDKVYAYGDDGQRDMAAEFDLHRNQGSPWGIAYANKRLYVAESASDKVFAYRDDGQHDPVADFSLHGDNSIPWGIAYADGRFYVGDWTGRNVFAYRVEGVSGTEFAYGAGDAITTMPTGLWDPDRIGDGRRTVQGTTAIFDLDHGGFVESGSHRYTCESDLGCRIEDRVVTSGRIVEASSGVSAVDRSAFDSRFVGRSFRSGSYYMDFESAGRFVEDGRLQGSYSYANTGSYSGTMTLTYDGGQYGGNCTIELTFTSEASGASGFTCASGARGQSLWRLVGIGAPFLATPSDSDTELEVSFVDALEAGETRAYDIQVRVRTPQGIWAESCTVITSGESGSRRVTLSVADLEPGTAYEVRYRNRNASSCDAGTPGDWSPMDVGATAVGMPPEFLEGARTTRTIPENLPSGINVGEPVTATGADRLSYTIDGTDADSFGIVSDTGQIRTLENVVYDYETKNEYRVEVGAVNESGDRDTIEVTIHIGNLVASCGSSDQLNLRIHAANQRLTLRWSPVQPVSRQQDAVGYETQIRRGDTGEWVDRRRFLGRNFTHMVYAGLENEVDYQVRVRAVNAEGACGWSAPVSGIPTADLAPESSTDYIERHGPHRVGTPEQNIRFLTPRRCRHTGGGVTADAECTYESTGPDSVRILLDFDDPSRGSCEVTMAYSSLTAGSFTDECFDAGVNTNVPFDTGFTMPYPSPQGEDDPDPPASESEPQRAPRNQDEFDALVHELDDFIPGLCFGYCGIPGPSRSPGVATRIEHENDRTVYEFGEYTYENTGPSQGIVTLTMRKTGEVWSFTLDVEPSGNIRVTITPPDGGESVWPGLQHLDLTLGAQSILLPVPPTWSAAIAVETDVAPANLDGLHGLARGTCASAVQPAMCALLGDVWDRAFIGADGQVTQALVHDHSYRKIGRNRGEVTVEWALADGYSRSDLTQFQTNLLGTTWVFDLTFTSDAAGNAVLTIARDGHLPSVEERFVDFVGDGIHLETFPEELQLPDDPPQASGEDVSGVEVAAAVTSSSIDNDDVQTFLVSNTGATFSPGDWLEPKDGSDQRMMIVGTGVTAGGAAFGDSGIAAQGSLFAQSLLFPAEVDSLMTLSVVCMQVSGTIPARGARYFSRTKSPETAVQRCQRDCVVTGGDAIQGCVWRCEETASGSAPVPGASGHTGTSPIREFPAISNGPGTKQIMIGASENFEVATPAAIGNGQ